MILSLIKSKKFPPDRHAYLLQLMEKFNLCYRAKERQDIYFLPDLFEDVEPKHAWQKDDIIHFRYNYDDFSPDAFMRQFIVEMHQDIEQKKGKKQTDYDCICRPGRRFTCATRQ